MYNVGDIVVFVNIPGMRKICIGGDWEGALGIIIRIESKDHIMVRTFAYSVTAKRDVPSKDGDCTFTWIANERVIAKAENLPLRIF